MKTFNRLISTTCVALLFILTLTAQENNAILCSDGLDNDGDGFADCDDTECILLPNMGCNTCFSDGLSFADAVVSYNNTCANNVAIDSQKALGVSDHISGSVGFVSLGNEGTIILEFTNNVLTNSGNTDGDLWIFEVGNQVEATFVELLPADANTVNILLTEGITDTDGDGYYDFGQVAGATSFVDIDAFFVLSYTPGSLLFSQVKLTDAPGSCSTSTPGADIDAICALSSVSPTPQEINPTTCSDGIDNDGDGFTDCEDTGCLALPNQGCITCDNDGLSFADAVNFYNNTCPVNLYTNPAFSLGVSDAGSTYTSFVSLGEGGVLILDFINNILTNSGNPDDDIWVFETGPIVESTDVELLPLDAATEMILINEGLTDGDMDGYYDIGTIQGSTRGVDIDVLFGVAYPGGTLKFNSIKLTDVPQSCSTNSPGADIDAVCALFSLPVLPIELSMFTARLIELQKVELNWTTNSETTNSHFIIERSKDGLNFESIGSVQGAGTTSVIHQYRFIDETPLNDVSYYKLKQVDFDGTFGYSDLRSIKLNSTTEVTVYPNPMRNRMTIRAPSSIDFVQLYNHLGQMIMHIDADHQKSFDLSALASGSYIMEIVTEGETYLRKIVKQ